MSREWTISVNPSRLHVLIWALDVYWLDLGRRHAEYRRMGADQSAAVCLERKIETEELLKELKRMRDSYGQP
jgi:hypothetical protein